MSKSIILVCVHKPDILFSNEIYVPIHVGKEISNYNLDYIGDNTGINISHKNPYYCELTAQYWAWKNVNKSFIGLAHYRRYFEKIIDDNYAEKILTKYDVILSKPITRPFPIIEKIIAALSFEETYIFFNTIIELFPEYRKTLIDYFYNNNKDIAYNMFFCKKRII